MESGGVKPNRKKLVELCKELAEFLQESAEQIEGMTHDEAVVMETHRLVDEMNHYDSMIHQALHGKPV